MSLKVAIDKLKEDNRMTDINLKSSSISADDLKKQLERLPDLTAQAVKLDLDSASDHDALGDN
jgi:hypothetical protein